MPPLFKPYTKKFGVACVQKSHSFNIVDKMNNNTYIPKLPLGVVTLIGANNYLVLEQLIELHNGYVDFNRNYYYKNNITIKFDGYIGISLMRLARLCDMSDKTADICIKWLSKPFSYGNERNKPYITIIKGKDREKGRKNLYKVNKEAVKWLLDDLKKDTLAIPKGIKKKGKYECIENQTYAESQQSVYYETHNRLMYADNK